MRFGCCAGISGIESIENAGYDYVELPVAVVSPEAPDSEWAPVRRDIMSHTIRPEAWNVFFSNDIHVVGPEVDWERIQRYVRTVFERIAEVGGRIVVLGSGRARRLPDGFPMDEGRKQLRDFIRAAGDVAHENAAVLAIEPLNRRETNMINSVPEGLSCAQEINHPSVGVLADFFHMDEEQEPFDGIAQARHYLAHAHTADTGRLWPGSGSYDHPGFFAALKSAGYDARMSAECSWGDDPNTTRRQALEFLRKMDGN